MVVEWALLVVLYWQSESDPKGSKGSGGSVQGSALVKQVVASHGGQHGCGSTVGRKRYVQKRGFLT